MSRNGEGLHVAAGMWAFRYREGGKWKGKSTSIPATAKTKQAAFDFKTKFLVELTAPASAPVAPAVQPESKPARPVNPMALLTLKEAAEKHIDLRKALGKSKSTLHTDKMAASRLCKIFGPDRVLNTFQQLNELDDYIVKRRAKPSEQTGEVVGNHILNQELRLLRHLLQKAGLWKAIDPDKEFKQLEEPLERIGKVMSNAQLERLVALANKTDDELKPVNDRWFVSWNATILAHQTGCRGIEIKKLKLKDIHLDARRPFIEVSSKTRAGNRIIELTQVAQMALHNLLRRAVQCGSSEPEHHLLPLCLSKCTRKDDPRRDQRGFDPARHQQSWRSGWRSLKAAARIPKDYRFHDNRVTFVTNLAEAGQSTDAMLKLVGHASRKMLQHYTYVREGKAAEAIRAIESQTGAAFHALLNPSAKIAQIERSQ